MRVETVFQFSVRTHREIQPLSVGIAKSSDRANLPATGHPRLEFPDHFAGPLDAGGTLVYEPALRPLGHLPRVRPDLGDCSSDL
jgi:hypothetical protein